MCTECGCWTTDVISSQLADTLQTTINDLEDGIDGMTETATTVATIHRKMVSELQTQLTVLEKSCSSITKLEDDHAREMAIVDERINTVVQNRSYLKIDDQDDTILMLHVPKKVLVSEHRVAGTAWAVSHAKEESHSKALIDLAQALLANTKQAVELEGAVRVAVKGEFQQLHHEYVAHIADNVLQDGIRVWVSKSNIFATLMTECLLRIEGAQLVIEPTKTCFDEHCLRELHNKFRLDHTCSDMQRTKFTIDLRDVEELKFTNRRANIPGTCDETSPHWEPPKYHQCVYIRTCVFREYYLAERRNEPQDKAWVSLQQGVPDGSPNLLCEKLVRYWQEANQSRS
ncbi:hypothetical protein PMIN06_008243 [Paraphaeosphaeria minitans]|uniref:Uncharacterized protein n=1 Tax=Paraphaeosphaeria minitans TaxID=565426 RepID=A0A9P6GQ75_9PLEO|nr:hypothetical protein PMIN01_02030 [Paraphaeosphaeria minitans]